MYNVPTAIKLPQIAIVKAPGLLPMQYKTSELAEDLGVSAHTITEWAKAGAPHNHDERGHIWISGTDLAKWVEDTRLQRKKSGRYKLEDHEAYCLHCKKPVELINPTEVPGQGKLFYIKGKCPNCGCTINRGGRKNG